MTSLFFPQTQKNFTEFSDIKSQLDKYDVYFERWQAQFPINDDDSQETILKAYEHELAPFMKNNNFQSADVINVHTGTPNLPALRDKFIKEHIHSENEVRFFIDGSGIFWFHFDDGVIAKLTCHKGDFLSVPAGYKHWFDLAPAYFVKAIRIFSNQEGWVAQYTNSGADLKYGEV
jgi:1,2-dihydroxy-3-keto-5-methylthiopentene dioxygenase